MKTKDAAFVSYKVRILFFVAFFQKDGLTKFVNTAIIKIMNVIQI